MRDLIGTTIGGRYTIRQTVGKGGMAQVFRATDTRLQRTVALKILAPELSYNPEFTKRFEREARLAANLNHPAIVKVYDVGEEHDMRYIAMEFIAGRTLHDILNQHQGLGIGYAIPLLEPVGAALDYAHTQGAVHRDVKPHNIMVANDGRVVLADFGIAQPPDADSDGLTRTGTFMGTPEYVSPEQLETRRVDGKSDIYSFGITAYEVIVGCVPFSGSTPQLIVAHTQTPPPPPTSVDETLPPQLDALFAHVLAKQPSERFDTAAAFMHDLRHIAIRHALPIATQEQLAALVQPNSSVGKPTLVVTQDDTPVGSYAPAMAAAQPAPPQPPDSDSNDDPRVLGQSGIPAPWSNGGSGGDDGDGSDGSDDVQQPPNNGTQRIMIIVIAIVSLLVCSGIFLFTNKKTPELPITATATHTFIPIPTTQQTAPVVLPTTTDSVTTTVTDLPTSPTVATTPTDLPTSPTAAATPTDSPTSPTAAATPTDSPTSPTAAATPTDSPTAAATPTPIVLMPTNTPAPPATATSLPYPFLGASPYPAESVAP